MTLVLAFIAGTGVSFASILVPHSRSKNSVENFQTFRTTLATLPLASSKTRQK